MRIPEKPPPFPELLAAISPDRIRYIIAAGRLPQSARYLHWDDVQRRAPPNALSCEEWWVAIKLGRLGSARSIPLTSRDGEGFSYSMPDTVLEAAHRIDQLASGRIGLSDVVTNPATRDRYIVSSLMEEAITSSQLEGASTSRRVAKEMIRSGRAPLNKSERMIFNNYRAMHYVREQRHEKLTPTLIFELHRLVTDGTLDDPMDAGRLEPPDGERVQVFSPEGELLHTPPPADQLPARMEALCTFANREETAGFLHPVVRAIIVHFWLANDHPFADGNGRTARALFYWSMLSQGYWLTEYLTVSRILRHAPAQYARSFLYTETDDLDLTYFILHQLDVTLRAIEELERYLARKTGEIAETERRLRRYADLNHRQLALISHALRHPDAVYTFASHSISHNTVYETARTDLLDLALRGLLVRRRVGRRFQFHPAGDLAEKAPGV